MKTIAALGAVVALCFTPTVVAQGVVSILPMPSETPSTTPTPTPSPWPSGVPRPTGSPFPFPSQPPYGFPPYGFPPHHRPHHFPPPSETAGPEPSETNFGFKRAHARQFKPLEA